MNRQTRCVIWMAALLGLGASAAWAGIDKGAVDNIDVVVDPKHLDQFGPAVDVSALTQRLAKNLADADFPVRKAGARDFTHTLTAHFSRVSHQSTPAGFSFSVGNSDPRAPEFQKADVLTVECVLQDSKTAKAETETMRFGAETLAAMRGNALANALAEHASSTCYSLLENLDLEQASTPADAPGKRPRWMPNIRIEVKNVAPTAGGPPESIQPASAEEPKKELIIHNQGTPVIFKLGHERR